ncbi:MAG: hypothetical protein IPM98_05305 [Lewinellaceae bacterium]|nr:hypothetical protein [Lewinellaceae bacterium]
MYNFESVHPFGSENQLKGDAACNLPPVRTWGLTFASCLLVLALCYIRRVKTRRYPFALLFLALFACGGNKERIVQEKIAERVSEFRKKETERCRAALLADAGRIADSLLLYEALGEVNDSLRNRLPFKPVKPAHIAPMDSLPVKPIFDSTGGF